MQRGRIRTEPGQKRVRALSGGATIVDGTPLLVWEMPYYPVWYFDRGALGDLELVATGETKRSPSRGTATVYDAVVGERTLGGAAYGYDDSPIEDLNGKVALSWNAMDHWFEEDEEVFVHTRDPYTRVDTLPSSRRVRVEVDGVTVADSTSGRFLFETGLPTRYYLPKTDVRMDLLSPTDTATACPYKGTARYWDVTVDGETHSDIVWGYDTPLPEAERVAGYVSFYNEKVDIFIDEVRVERPKTKFS